MAAFALALAALVAFAALASAEPAVTENYANFGPDGTESTDFEEIDGVAYDQQSGDVFVLDRRAGALYRFEADGTPLDFTGSNPDIDGNKITGLSLGGPFSHFNSQVAVDSNSHVVYLTEEHAIRAFHPDGEPAAFTAGPGEGTNAIPGFDDASGVAVDGNGAIYVSDKEKGKVSVYAATGAPLTTFDIEEPRNLTVAPNGVLYVGHRFHDGGGPHGEIVKLVPSEFPVAATTTYEDSLFASTITFEISGVGLDPANGDVYVLEGNWLRQFDKEGHFLRFIARTGETGELGDDPKGVAVVGGGEEFQLYVGNSQGDGLGGIVSSKVAIFGEEIIEGPPTIGVTSAIDVNLNSATLRTRINPNTFETTYHFEYGLEDCSASACTSTAGGTIPAGHKLVRVVPAELEGLQPGTTYHYRVIATNAEGTTEGPDRIFTTPRSGLGFGLPDNRAWEMVSPPNKFGGRIIHASQGVMQAAADGEGLVYETVTSTEPNPEGNRALDFSTTLARRGAAGWSSKDLTSPYTEVAQLRFGGEFKAFSPNLERALLEQQGDTPLSPEASEQTPYLRENTEPATYRPLVTGKEGFANVPEGTVFGGGGSGQSAVAVRAIDPSLSHPVVTSQAPLVQGAAPGSLYQWNEGQLQLVSELPASEGGTSRIADAGSGWASIRNAVSEDGSRVFWKNEPDVFMGSALYVRDTVNQVTGRLDVKQTGASGAGTSRPIFRGAIADGTVVFFTDTKQLTADASPGGADLYRCEVGPVEGGILGCATLTDVSAPIAGSGEKAEVLKSVPGFSEDGSRVYFFSSAVLDTTPNQAGDTAVSGEPNLYLWEEGQGRRFIATLMPTEDPDWGGHHSTDGQDSNMSAAASPDGRYFAFMSARSLTGYDSRDAKSEEPVEEVFRYDALNDHLDCVSCNPSGASPVGVVSDPNNDNPPRVDTKSNWARRWVAAILPTSQESETAGVAFHRSRVVHDNGRVFFNAIDPLVSADSNGEWDVYQWEPTGVGDCTSSSEGAAIARSGGGCVSLLSSGTAEEEASFIDASEGGDDVFFLTPARLSVSDEDFELDVYDTRVGGVPATLPVVNECVGEACQAAPNPPNDPTPNSASFRGAGNVPSERCPASKRKVTRAGSARCVPKKHKKKRSHKAKRAASNRRASR